MSHKIRIPSCAKCKDNGRYQFTDLNGYSGETFCTCKKGVAQKNRAMQNPRHCPICCTHHGKTIRSRIINSRLEVIYVKCPHFCR